MNLKQTLFKAISPADNTSIPQVVFNRQDNVLTPYIADVYGLHFSGPWNSSVVENTCDAALKACTPPAGGILSPSCVLNCGPIFQETPNEDIVNMTWAAGDHSISLSYVPPLFVDKSTVNCLEKNLLLAFEVGLDQIDNQLSKPYGRMSEGQIAGTVVGCVALSALGIAACMLTYRAHRGAQRRRNALNNPRNAGVELQSR